MLKVFGETLKSAKKTFSVIRYCIFTGGTTYLKAVMEADMNVNNIKFIVHGNIIKLVVFILQLYV